MLGLGGLGLVSLVARPAGAAAAPEAFVRDLAGELLATLRDRSLSTAERLRRVDRLVDRSFAFERIAKIALGRYWKVASERERAEFSALFKAAVLASYSRRFNEYAEHELRVAAAAPAGEQASVESYLEGGRAPVRLDWRLAPTDGGWRVLDVTVEGVSLLVTYRNEFATVIEQGGGRVSALIGELRNRAGATSPSASG
jgi:phospholipid transport system substrate-binding protein